MLSGLFKLLLMIDTGTWRSQFWPQIEIHALELQAKKANECEKQRSNTQVKSRDQGSKKKQIREAYNFYKYSTLNNKILPLIKLNEKF